MRRQFLVFVTCFQTNSFNWYCIVFQQFMDTVSGSYKLFIPGARGNWDWSRICEISYGYKRPNFLPRWFTGQAQKYPIALRKNNRGSDIAVSFSKWRKNWINRENCLTPHLERMIKWGLFYRGENELHFWTPREERFARVWSHVRGVCGLYLGLRKWKSGQGPAKGCRTIDEWMNECTNELIN
jgi:hypothetical protein